MKKYTVRKRHTKRRRRRQNKRTRIGGNAITNKFADWKAAVHTKFQSVRPIVDKPYDSKYYVVKDGLLEIISRTTIDKEIEEKYDDDIKGHVYVLVDNIILPSYQVNPSTRSHIISVLFENIPKSFLSDEQQIRYNDANTIYKGSAANECFTDTKECRDAASEILKKYNLV
jgi:hypothetical protein